MNVHSLFLRREFCIESALTPNDAIARVRAAVADDYSGGFLFHRRPFRGTVGADQFELRRLRYRARAVNPRIHGTFEPTPNGVRLRGTIQLTLLQLANVVLWVAGLVVIGIVTTAQRPVFDPVTLVPFGLAPASFLISLTSFLIQVRWTTRTLTQIVNGTGSEVTASVSVGGAK
jgi:hypothetical protein